MITCYTKQWLVLGFAAEVPIGLLYKGIVDSSVDLDLIRRSGNNQI